MEYRLKQHVRAVQFLKDMDRPDWLEEVTYSRPGMRNCFYEDHGVWYLRDCTGTRFAVGFTDWIVMDPAGQMLLINDADFEANYEAVYG